MHRISLIAPRGNTLSITAAGSGPPLVLLHGFPLDHRLWRHQIEGLSPHFHIIAPEFRGFGKSTLNEDSYTLKDLADDVEFIREHLAGAQPIRLCGLSMGGYVAFEYWRHYRQHVAALILANTKPTADDEAARASRLQMAKTALDVGAWPAVEGMLPKLLCEPTRQQQPDVVELVESMMRDSAPESIAAAQQAMASRADFSAALPTIQVPTLVITGQYDSIAPVAETRSWASRIAGAQFECLPEAGHLTPLEQPARFNDALLTRFF